MIYAHLSNHSRARMGAAERHLPYEWVESAVQANGSASVRRRRLSVQYIEIGVSHTNSLSELSAVSGP